MPTFREKTDPEKNKEQRMLAAVGGLFIGLGIALTPANPAVGGTLINIGTAFPADKLMSAIQNRRKNWLLQTDALESDLRQVLSRAFDVAVQRIEAIWIGDETRGFIDQGEEGLLHRHYMQLKASNQPQDILTLQNISLIFVSLREYAQNIFDSDENLKKVIAPDNITFLTSGAPVDELTEEGAKSIFIEQLKHGFWEGHDNYLEEYIENHLYDLVVESFWNVIRDKNEVSQRAFSAYKILVDRLIFSALMNTDMGVVDIRNLLLELQKQTEQWFQTISNQMTPALGTDTTNINTGDNYFIEKLIVVDSSEDLDDIDEPLSERPLIRYFNLPRRDYEQFIGRDREKEIIFQFLKPTHRSFELSLEGIGGIGKSTLAIEIGYHFKDNIDSIPEAERFDAVIWVSAKEEELIGGEIIPYDKGRISNTLANIFRDIAIAFDRRDILDGEVDEQRYALINQLLAKHRTLLLIDNFESIVDKTVETFLRQIPEPSKVIVTTRHRVVGADPLRVTAMSEDESLQFIQHEWDSKNKRSTLQLNDEQQKKLYRRTGGVPIALKWSIAQMIHGRGIEDTLSRFSEVSGDIKKFCFERSTELLTQDALDILTAIALFPRPALRNEAGIISGVSEDEISRDEALIMLEDLSLIDRDEDTFSILPLTRQYILEIREPLQLEPLHQRYRQFQEQKEEKIALLLEAGEKKHNVGDWESARKLFEESLNESEQIDSEESIIKSLLFLSDNAYHQWMLDSAIEFSTRLESISLANGDLTNLALSYDKLGRVLIRKLDFAQANDYLQKSLKIKTDSGQVESLPYTLNLLGNLNINLRDLSQAKIYLNKSIETSTVINNLASLCYALNGRGRVRSIQRDFIKAQKDFEKALTLSRELENKFMIAFTVNRLASLHLEMGNYDDAEELTREALNIGNESGNKLTIAISLNRLGIIALRRQDKTQAKQLFESTLENSYQMNNTLLIFDTLTKLVSICKAEEDYSAAEGYLRKAIEVARELKNTSKLVSSLIDLALVYRRQGNFEQAIILLTMAEEENIKTNRVSHTIGILLSMCSIVFDMEDYPKAMNYALEAYEISKHIGNSSITLEALRWITKIHITEGDYTQANKYLEEGLDFAIEVEDEQNVLNFLSRLVKNSLDQRDVSNAIEHLENTFLVMISWQRRPSIMPVFEKFLEQVEGILNPEEVEYYRENLFARTQMLLKIKHKSGVINFLETQAQQDFSKGNYSQALTYLMKVLLATTSGNDIRRIAQDVEALAVRLEKTGELPTAITYRRGAVELYQTTGNLIPVSVNYDFLIRSARKLGDYTSMKAFALDNLKLKEELNDKREIRKMAYAVASASMKLDDLDDAQRYFEMNLQIREELNDRPGIPLDLNSLGKVAMAKGDHSLAINYFSRGMEVSMELEDEESKAIALFNLGTAYFETGNDVMALDSFTQSLAICQKLNMEHWLNRNLQAIELIKKEP